MNTKERIERLEKEIKTLKEELAGAKFHQKVPMYEIEFVNNNNTVYGRKGEKKLYPYSRIIYILNQGFGKLCNEEDIEELGINLLNKYGLPPYKVMLTRKEVIDAIKKYEHKNGNDKSNMQ